MASPRFERHLCAPHTINLALITYQNALAHRTAASGISSERAMTKRHSASSMSAGVKMDESQLVRHLWSSSLKYLSKLSSRI